MKYNVLITSTEHYELDLEAGSEQEAIDMALAILESTEAQARYHSDSSGTEEANEE